MTNEQFKHRVDRLCAGLRPLMKVHRETGGVLVQLDYCVQKLFEPRKMGEGAIGDTNIKFDTADMLRNLRHKLDTMIKELES